RFAGDVCAARELELHFEMPTSLGDLKLGPNVRREVFLVFKEGINNILRHAGCTHLSIRFLVHEGWLNLWLKDNGQGFDPCQGGDGHGLTNMQQRAARLGGILKVSSGRGEGTTLHLSVPLGPIRRTRA